MKSQHSTLLAEVRTFRQNHPDVRYVDLIALDIPGHFYGKRYPIEMLEKVAAGSPLKLPQNAVLLGAQGGLFKIGDYCFHDGDPDANRRLVPGTLKPVSWESQPLGQMLITSDGTGRTHRVRAARSVGQGAGTPAPQGHSPGGGRLNWSFTCSTKNSTTACRNLPATR